jgi:hypothetical protein
MSAIPGVDDVGGEPTRVEVERRYVGTRRSFVRGLVGGCGLLAVSALGKLPLWRPGAAHAVAGTEWLNCADYGGWSGYDNNTKICVGGPYSSTYCGSDKWARNGLYNSVYWYPQQACGEANPYLPKRNAWRWTHNSTPYRCADVLACSQVTCSFAICAAANP